MKQTRLDKVRDLLDKERAIAAIWQTGDVQTIRPDLDEDQAWEVLQRVDHYCDAEFGITWDIIRQNAEDVFPSLSKAKKGKK